MTGILLAFFGIFIFSDTIKGVTTMTHLYSRRCTYARTLIPPQPSERSERGRTYASYTYEGGTTMTHLYSRRCTGARTLIPPQPSERSERGRTYASTHMKAVHHMKAENDKLGFFCGSGVIFDHF